MMEAIVLFLDVNCVSRRPTWATQLYVTQCPCLRFRGSMRLRVFLRLQDLPGFRVVTGLSLFSCVCVCVGGVGGGGWGETDRQKDRQTDKQRNRQTDRQTDRDRQRQTDRQRQRQRERV